MQTRREFLAHAAYLGGGAGISTTLFAAIERALAVEPERPSSFLDAEHVVILMQENRSFDHAFGMLRGVRGFNDPRAIRLRNGNPVWVQTNKRGESYVPFRLEMNDSNSTWMGCLPHSWTDQTDARNDGQYDGWLEAKRSGNDGYADMPLTLGYYTRDDIPFYYALADAFTICDQHFCSSLTGTTPNRNYLWTGTIRAEQDPNSPANVLNSDSDLDTNVSWSTFPERLEDLGVSWKVYQNELSIEAGLAAEEAAWLANFTDNPLEFFSQYHVRQTPSHRAFLEASARELPRQIAELERAAAGSDRSTVESDTFRDVVRKKRALLARVERARKRYNQQTFDQLSPRDKNLLVKAFCTNVGDPHYRQLTEIKYRDGDTERRVQVPKGDLLHQFRRDVASGSLPTVSWVVPPERYSDHPGSAWYGAWYIAEMLDILTQDPTIWKKTVFILTYDENDGYFDHVPPFVPPDPRRPETGRTSKSIDAALDYVYREDEVKRKAPGDCRTSPIGLGYRVPLVIASPWSRGGYVCSQVFDHTSPLQFLEKFLSKKLGKEIRETNISSWRRAVCGDLTSTFQPATADLGKRIEHPSRDEFVEQIHRAKFKPLPSGFKTLSNREIEELRADAMKSPRMPRQEPGTRPSCPLPYELSVDGGLSIDGEQFEIRFAVGASRFGAKSAGAPFVVYSRHGDADLRSRNYAVSPGEDVKDSWQLDEFSDGRYDLEVYGPNGFFRGFRGDAGPKISVSMPSELAQSAKPKRSVQVVILNVGDRAYDVEIRDGSYNLPAQRAQVRPKETTTLVFDCEASFGWYDLNVQVDGFERYSQRYAGRVETGEPSFSDPVMGRGLS